MAYVRRVVHSPLNQSASRSRPSQREAEPFEQAVDSNVAVVGLGIDAMDVVLLEQPRDHGAERLRRQAGALFRGREGDADLSGPRLIGREAHGAVAAQVPSAPVDGGQLHPRPGIAEVGTLLGRDETFAVGRRVRGVPRLVAGYLGVAAV